MDENLNNEELLDSEHLNEEPKINEDELIETFGDENYESFIMPDGTMNLRYLEKVNLIGDFVPIKLSFNQFPASLKNDILLKLISGPLFIIVFMLLFIFKIIAFKITIPFIIIGLLLIFSGIMRFKICQNDNIVKF